MADQPMTDQPAQSMVDQPEQQTYAGEFFDLSITSINNKYGALHNIGVILYGINFPLKKFITELEMILKDEQGGASDDKAEKRKKRLIFLQHCNSLLELQTFFERFCNYLNGQDGSGKQYPNFIVITAAGGNIIIVFAQLIMNIINMVITNITDKEFLRYTFADVIFKMCNNDEELATNVYSIILSKMTDPLTDPLEIAYCILDYHALSTAVIAALKGHPTTIDKIQIIPQTNGDERYTEAYTLHNSKLKSFIDTISLIPTNITLLIPTNRTLLAILQLEFQVGADDIVRKIVYHFTTNPAMLKVLKEIADSPASDCDFKLSPNIFQTRDQESESMVYGLISDMAVLNIGSSDMQQKGGNPDEKDIQELITMLSELNIDIGPDIEKLSTMFSQLNIDSEKRKDLRKDFILIAQLLKQAISNKVNAGFFLLRAKTLIDCRKYYKPRYTPKQLKVFKQSCMTKYKDLYPQTIQQIHLDEAAAELKKQKKDPKKNSCYIYLTHLMEKKKAIRTSTQMTTDQFIEFFVNGYFKQANKTGFMAPLVIPTENKTEAIIAYTRNITSNINTYINTWFMVRLTPQGAPAKSSLQSGDYSYESLVKCFLSLDTIIINPSPIPLLAADIMNDFLNNPVFHTETILDELISTFNTNRSNKCVMLPSDILLVPTVYQVYQVHLSRIKEILDSTLNSGYGYPDGLRITINAIITEQMKDITEITSILEVNESKQLLTDYTKLDIDKGKGPRLTIKKTPYSNFKKGGTKYYKKNITFKKKIVKKTNEKLKTKSKKTRRQKNLRKVTLKHKKPRKHKSIKHKYRKHKL